MERLTKHSKQTSHENGICCTHFYGPECRGVGGNCAMNCKWEEAAWSRLAAYEDTGLEPEQCENAKAIIASAFSDDTSKAERIRELLKADRDGRLVVRWKWKVYRYATGEIDLVCPFCCALNAHGDLREFDLRDWHYCRWCGTRLEGIV